ncbi:hypothetical protein ANCCAN_22907, partial [Ancylostoma caninum]
LRETIRVLVRNLQLRYLLLYEIDVIYRLVQCSVPQGYGSVAFPMFNNIGFVLNIVSVLVYIVSFYMVKRSRANSKMRTVFKSIFVTVAIVIVGWFATFLINSLSFLITHSDYVRTVIGLYAGITVNIGLAANFFVYYAINNEYREVIKQMFGHCSYHAKVQVQDVSTFHGRVDINRKSIIANHE